MIYAFSINFIFHKKKYGFLRIYNKIIYIMVYFTSWFINIAFYFRLWHYVILYIDRLYFTFLEAFKF